MKKILAFTGSSSQDSINEKLVKSIIKEFPNEQIQFLDLKTFNVPIYSQEIEQHGIPKPIEELFELFAQADAFILASPEHNGLLSTLLKNTIDWLSRIDQKFFHKKPVLLLSTSPGRTGGETHLQILGELALRWGALFVEKYSLGSFDQSFDKETLSIKNPKEREKLKRVTKAVINSRPQKKKDNVEVVLNYFKSFQKGDITEVLNTFHSDCYIVSVKEEERPKEQLHGIYRTKEEAKQFLANINTLFNTRDFSVEQVSAAGGDLVMANGTFSHEVKSTGKLFNSSWVQLCKIEDEKIKEYRFYEDSAAYIAASTK